MIKGKYVCQVTMDYSIDETQSPPLILERLKEWAENGIFEENLKSMLEDRNTSVTIERQFADFYRVEDKA